MKKLLLLAIALFTVQVYAQKELEVVELSNGQKIQLYDDFTWKYIGKVSSGATYTTTNKEDSGIKLPVTHKTTTKKPQPRKTYSSSSSSTYSSRCGAPTKKGGYCKRMVRGGGRCYQHR